MNPLLIFLLAFALSKLVSAVKSNDWAQGIIWGVCLILLLLAEFGGHVAVVR